MIPNTSTLTTWIGISAALSIAALCRAQMNDRNTDESAATEIHFNGRRLTPLVNGVATNNDALSRDIRSRILHKTTTATQYLRTLGEVVQARSEPRTHVLLQLHRLPSKDDRKALRDAGIALLTYVPNNGWLTGVSKESGKVLATTALVRWGATLGRDDKIAPRLVTHGIPSWSKTSDGKTRFSVRVFEDTKVEDVRNRFTTLGITTLSSDNVLHYMIVEGETDALTKIADCDEVEHVDSAPLPRRTFNDTTRALVHVEPLQLPPNNLSGRGIKVGIWDGGAIDTGHPDFDVRLAVVDGAKGINDHATHVAGAIGGSGVGSPTQGGTPYQWRGIAPTVQFVIYDFDGDPATEHQNALVNYGVDVSQNSWGTVVEWANRDVFGDYSMESQNYDMIVRGCYGRRVPICFAAGNSRADVDPISHQPLPLHPLGYICIAPPATAKNVITVGATTDATSVEPYSSFGPTDDGRTKPDIVAPGHDVVSALPGGQYGALSGTSMACPVVSGALALLMEHVQSLYTGLRLLPSTYKALLLHSATDIAKPGPDYQTGFGQLNVQTADALLQSKSFVEATIAANGQTDNYTIRVATGTTELKVTLAWDDYPGNQLVNDLDLTLVDPSGAIHLPWHTDPQNPDANAVTGPDHVNVVEQIKVLNPQTGTWTIFVKGQNVPQAPQTYSLVSSNLIGGVNSQLLIVNNDGKQTLTIDDITTSANWIGIGSRSLTVAPNDSQAVLIFLKSSGLAPGKYTDTLTITSNDPQTPISHVSVEVNVSQPDSPPNAPSDPLPQTGTIKQPTDITLSWKAVDPDAGDTLTFDVYMGQTSGNLQPISLSQTGTSLTKKGLTSDTTYFWSVAARDTHGLVTTGPEWTFRTFTATDDEDGDALTNQKEMTLGTNPFMTDTDGDGFSDADEVLRGSDPLDQTKTPANMGVFLSDDFADGKNDRWSQKSQSMGSWQVVTGMSHSDQYAVSITGGPDGNGGFYGEISSGLIPVPKGTEVRLSAYVKGRGTLVLYEYDKQGQLLQQHSSQPFDQPDFTFVKLLCKLTSNTTSVRIGLASTHNSIVYFDDVKLEKTASVLIYTK